MRSAATIRSAASVRSAAAAVLLVAALPTPPALAAQDVSVAAYLDRGEVGVGETFTLNLELRGSQRFDGEPELPDLTAFATFLRRSSQTSLRMVNGRSTVSLTLQYLFQATAEGTFEIRPITVEADDRTMTTEALTVRVATAGPPTGRPGAGARGGAAAGGGTPGPASRDDLFIVAEPNKLRVRQNEPVIVEYRLYTRVDVRSYGITRLPGTAGFWVEEFDLPPQPRVERVVRGGLAYTTAVVRKVALYPTSAGTRTLEPLAIEAQVRVQRRSAFDDFFSGIFDRGSLFGTNAPVGAASAPVEIEVLPLPAAGRPAEFTGLVGDLAVTATTDRDSLAANEAVTVRVEARGTGNLKALAPPELALPPTVDAFPPESSERLRVTDAGVEGTLSWEYVLIPRAPGQLTIPGLELGYYDAGAERYETAASAPIALRVTGRAAADGLPGTRARSAVESLRADIRFISTGPPRLRPRGDTAFSGAWFWVAFLAPAGLVAGAAGVRRRRERLEGDRAYARDRRAATAARKRLVRAARLVRGDDARAFYAETAQALEGFGADKLDAAAAGIIRHDLREALAGRGASADALDEYFAVLEACDRHRFAPGESAIEARRAFLARAEAALSALVREMRR